MSLAPFPIQPELTAVAIAYRNSALIADGVLPRIAVGKQEFKYSKATLADAFTVPDTKVGRKSQPNQVETSGTEVTSSTNDYGLDDPIPQNDIDNASAGQNLLGESTQFLTDLIMLDREVRTAALVFDTNQYATANKVTLSGTTQWSDFANSDPVAAHLAGLDSMIMRGNVGVYGRTTWTKLSTHPKICKAIFGNNTDAGIVSRQAFAELFELEEVLVGEGWLNTARKGQAPVMTRVWGKHAALLHRNKLATNQRGTTFGFTAQFGNRIAGSQVDGNIGLRGGQMVRVGESVKEVITANDLGYFFQNAVA